MTSQGAKERSCDRKKRYASERAANHAASHYQLLGVGILRSYDCPHCGGWHLTSKPKHRRT